jgi:hypothetical protein
MTVYQPGMQADAAVMFSHAVNSRRATGGS